MRKAIIDLGTNIFNLLIVDVEGQDFQRIYHHKIGVGFGLGGINQNRLAIDAQERGMNALRQFRRRCDEYHADTIVAIGTSALRSAENSQDFIREVYDELMIDIQLISGDQEAEWIYQGVRRTFDFKENAIIVDIGGGSIEFILANQHGVVKEISLNIGISRMYQAIPTSNPIDEKDIHAIEIWLENHVGNQLDDMKCNTLIGASGTYETFYEMIVGQKFTNQTMSYHYNSNQLEEVLNQLIFSHRPEINELGEDVPIRQMMGPMTCVFIKWMMRKLAVQESYVSPYSMKEGIIFWDR